MHACFPEGTDSLDKPVRSLYVVLGGKRLFDVIFSLILLASFLPVLAVLIPLIVVTSSGGAFYYDEREAKYGRQFKMFKLRTLFVGTDKVTFVGYFIRPIALDEILQFINVLRGDMSLIGPRPHRPQDAAKYAKACARYYKRLVLKPGLTGLAQVRYHFPRSEEEIGKMIDSDLEYVEKQSFLLDLMILLRTAKILFTGH